MSTMFGQVNFNCFSVSQSTNLQPSLYGLILNSILWVMRLCSLATFSLYCGLEQRWWGVQSFSVQDCMAPKERDTRMPTFWCACTVHATTHRQTETCCILSLQLVVRVVMLDVQLVVGRLASNFGAEVMNQGWKKWSPLWVMYSGQAPTVVS